MNLPILGSNYLTRWFCIIKYDILVLNYQLRGKYSSMNHKIRCIVFVLLFSTRMSQSHLAYSTSDGHIDLNLASAAWHAGVWWYTAYAIWQACQDWFTCVNRYWLKLTPRQQFARWVCSLVSAGICTMQTVHLPSILSNAFCSLAM